MSEQRDPRVDPRPGDVLCVNDGHRRRITARLKGQYGGKAISKLRRTPIEVKNG